MDRFDVRARSADVLEESDLMEEFAEEEATAYVLIVQGIAYAFDALEGGVLPDENAHIFELSEPHNDIPQSSAGVFELHFDNCSYSLYTNNSHIIAEEGAPILMMEVIDYERHEHGFAKEMTEDVDSRETRYD